MAKRAFDYESDIPAGYYDQVFRRGHGVQSKWHHLKFRHFARALAGASGTLVDAGCGPGTFSSFVPSALKYTGLDVSVTQLNYCRATYPAANRVFDVIQDGVWPIADNSADFVTCIEVIEHLSAEQNKKLLNEAYRVLKSGGTIHVSTPNYGSLWPVLEWFVNRVAPVKYDDQHVSLFKAEKLSELLRQHGFSSKVSTYLFAAPFVAPLSWTLADKVDAIEARLNYLGGGFLLFAVAQKPVETVNR